MTLPVPAPPTRAAGSQLTAPIYEDDVTDGVTFLANPPIFKGTQSGAQSIANSTVTALLLGTEARDTYNGHSTSVNTSRYTSQRDGAYQVTGYYAAAANATGIRLVRLAKNGTYIAPSQTSVPTAGTSIDTNIMVTAEIELVTGDYVEVTVFQTSGGALNTTPSDSGMYVRWVHALAS